MPATFETISSGKIAFGVAPSITIPAPAGLKVGEFMVALGSMNFGGPSTINLPGGWSKLDQTEPAIGNPKAFLGFKEAEQADLGANFVFTHTEGGTRPWVVGIYRISGTLGVDVFAVGTVNDVVTAIVPAPDLVTTKDNALILRVALINSTGGVITGITHPGGHTEQAEEIQPGSATINGSWVTGDVLKTPPGSIGVANFTHDGGGNTRAIAYSLSMSPTLPGSGGIMGGAETMRETIERGTPIKNPFGGRMRRNACLCIGKCVCS